MKHVLLIAALSLMLSAVAQATDDGCPQCSVPAPQPAGAPSGPGAPPCGPGSPTGPCG